MKTPNVKNSKVKNEQEHQGSIWTHPYMIYILLTTGLFVLLLMIGWMALEQGWIPNRGISTG